MKFEKLREEVCRANKEISRTGLAILTWGNVSGIDREAGVMAIKPSGVDYEVLKPADIVVLDIKTGECIDGRLKPSCDTPTHLYLCRAFKISGGIVHAHSRYATAFAQAGVEVPCYGTTHADNFYGTIPVTRMMTQKEVRSDYEVNTGKVIVERFEKGKINPDSIPAVLVAGHGPFAWGTSVAKALENALVLEEVAGMALRSTRLNRGLKPIPQYLLDKHFLRKHGTGSYYGQK
jgi:L-ribulose-5-phosphate 4-epimerase